MSRNGKTFTLGRAVFIAIVALAFLLAIILMFGLTAWNVDETIKAPQLVVLSNDSRVYYGGDFDIQVVYKYNDGRIEYPTSSNTIKYESSEPLVSVNSDGKVQVLEDVYNGDSEYQEHQVDITISSSIENVESITISVKVVPIYTYSITKYYYDADTFELTSEMLPAWKEQTVSEIADPVSPNSNYVFDNWYVVRIGDETLSNPMEFYPGDKYSWGDDICIKPKFCADVQFDIDKMPIGEEAPAPVKIYYDEPIVNAFPELRDASNGWAFDGWFTEKGGGGYENGVQNGVFRAAAPVLYAKWSGIATLNLTNIIYINEEGNIMSTDNTVGTFSNTVKTSIPVVYHGAVDLSASKPLYNVGKFGGWSTELYGGGTSITDEGGRGIYNSINLQLYDKVLVSAKIDYNDATGNYDESYKEIQIVYGAENKNILELEPQKAGWDFNGWRVLYGSDSSDSQQDNAHDSLLKNIEIVAQWKLELKHNIVIPNHNNIPSLMLSYGDDCGVLLQEPSDKEWGSWTFGGWYAENEEGTWVKVNKISDCVSIGCDDLYAKWFLPELELFTVNPIYASYGLINGIIYGKSIGELLPIPDGYTHAFGWYTSLDGVAQRIDRDTTKFPKEMTHLYFREQNIKIQVKLDHNAGEETVSNAYNGDVEAIYGQPLENLAANIPERTGYKFLGYYYDDPDNLYYKDDMTGAQDWYILPEGDEKITLRALWDGNVYTVTLDQSQIEYDKSYADEVGSPEILVKYGSSMPAGYKAPVRVGYTFKGYFSADGMTQYYDASMSSVSRWDQDKEVPIIYAQWEANTISASSENSSLTIKNANKSKSTKISGNGGSGKYTFEIISDSHPNLKSCAINSSGELTLTSNKNADNSGVVAVQVCDKRTGKCYELSINYKTKYEGCFAPGTQILLDDGTQKPVEELNGDEMLLVWNLYTGTFDSAPILFIDSEPEAICKNTNLYFSDGTSIKVIYEHGFWDYNLNEWVFLRNDAEQYIGHWFSKQSIDSQGNMVNEKVQLVNVVITEEMTTAWSPVTFGHLCYYANGLLSMPGATEGLINIFEVDRETLKIDEAKMAEDIEKYGLFTYEDFAAYIPEEIFYAFNGQYLKVSIGKGLMTWDDIFALVDRYQQFW